jgi:hypothetical protein
LVAELPGVFPVEVDFFFLLEAVKPFTFLLPLLGAEADAAVNVEVLAPLLASGVPS